jgi:hypothetical protein
MEDDSKQGSQQSKKEGFWDLVAKIIVVFALFC